MFLANNTIPERHLSVTHTISFSGTTISVCLVQFRLIQVKLRFLLADLFVAVMVFAP